MSVETDSRLLPLALMLLVWAAPTLARDACNGPSVVIDAPTRDVLSGDKLRVQVKPKDGAVLTALSISALGAPAWTLEQNFPVPGITGYAEIQVPYSVGRYDPRSVMLPAKVTTNVTVVATDSAGICSASIPVTTRDVGVYAVVVGIDSYPKAGGQIQLQYARKDADSIAQHLLTNFDEIKDDHIYLLTDPWPAGEGPDAFERIRQPDPSRGNILRSLDNAIARMDRFGTIIFYYAGHGFAGLGIQPYTQSHYLLAADSELDHDANMIWIDDILNRIARAGVERNVVIIDACFSGSIIQSGQVTTSLISGRRALGGPVDNAFPMPANAARKVYVLTAGFGDQESSEFAEIGHGIFTYYLLQSGDVPATNITINSAFDYASKAVKNSPLLRGKQQEPYAVGADTGEHMVWRRNLP